MRVLHFEIEESKVNKKRKVLVAVAENGEKFVVSGDHWAPTYLEPYEKSFDSSGLYDEKGKIKT